jgi:serine/threonine protein kinase
MGRKLDHRSDLFSLGTVMYEMLTLAAPFSAATEVELIFAVRDARKRGAREIEPTVPEELDDILNKLMSRSRSGRYQSGAELALALRLFLDRYRPGYRRSHFGRFMRTIFEQDIERELRLLEEYVIEGADPSKVGQNLIADALGENAPYTGFTAATIGGGGTGGSASGTGNFPRVEQRPPTDLHAEQTRILTRNQPVPQGETGPVQPPRPPLSELSTQILDRGAMAAPPPERPGLHELQTQIKALPDLHSQNTQILSLPRGGGDQRQPERKPLSDLQTKIIVREEDLLPPGQEDTQAPTMLKLEKLDEEATGPGAKTIERASERPRRDTLPSLDDSVIVDAEATREGHGGVRGHGARGGGAGSSGGGFDESEESTTGATLPLSDEDLEPGTES